MNPKSKSLTPTQVVRDLFFKDKLNATSFVGNYSELFAQHKPVDAAAFMAMVNEHAPRKLSEVFAALEQSNQRHQKGLTTAELRAGMKQFLIVDSFNGFDRERQAVKYLQSKFPALNIYQDSKLDTDYGADIVIDGTVAGVKKFVMGIQVKPKSYFTSNPQPGLVKNREIDNGKFARFLTDHDASVKFLVYEATTDGWQWNNIEAIVERIEEAYRDKVLKSKLLNQKTGIDFLTEDGIMDEADEDMLIALLLRRKQNRRK